MNTPRKWKFHTIDIEANPIIVHGVNVWQHSWIKLEGGKFQVPHPSYPWQRHDVWPYKIAGPDGDVYFACGEVSNNVWVFYVLDA